MIRRISNRESVITVALSLRTFTWCSSRALLNKSTEGGSSNHISNGKSSIEDLLSELDVFDLGSSSSGSDRNTSSYFNKSNRTSSSSSATSATATTTTTISAAAAAKAGGKSSQSSEVEGDASVRQLRAKRHQLKEKIGYVASVAAELEREASITKASGGRAASKLNAFPTAQTALTTTELLEGKSPQAFVAAKKGIDGGEEEETTPLLTHCGCAAVVTLVARVTRAPAEAKAEEQTEGSDAIMVARFEVEYEVPIHLAELVTTASPKNKGEGVKTRVTVSTFGQTLCLYALHNIKEGDVVHVLGHLIPERLMMGANSGSASLAVCVLPVGGNLSVLISGSE